MSRQIKKLWYIYTMEYYSAQKQGNLTVCESMDGPRIMLSEISQRKTSIIDFTRVEFNEQNQNKLKKQIPRQNKLKAVRVERILGMGKKHEGIK